VQLDVYPRPRDVSHLAGECQTAEMTWALVHVVVPGSEWRFEGGFLMTARPLTGERHLICIQFQKAGKNDTVAKLKNLL
jgi:hypothetical protein